MNDSTFVCASKKKKKKSAGAVEYTDCISAERYPHPRVS